MFNRDVVFPILMIVMSAMVLAVIPNFTMPSYQQDASVGANFFPTVLAISQIVICIALLVQRKVNQQDTTDKNPIFSKMSLFGLGFLIGYAVLISLAGYLIASLLAFTLYLAYLRTKKVAYYIVAWVFVFVVYYLFGHVFVISLPEGIILRGLYV